MAFVWLIWGAGHSVMALPRLRTSLGVSEVAWRRIYNAVALVSLIVPLLVMFRFERAALPLFEWGGLLVICPWLARLLAVLIFVDTLRVYSSAEFMGLKAPDHESRPGFSFTHRFVRHPWYFAILLLLWVRDLSGPGLATSAALSLYLVVGARLEEGRLDRSFGDIWRDYAARVPMLLPSPVRHLDAAGLQAMRARRS